MKYRVLVMGMAGLAIGAALHGGSAPPTPNITNAS
jgi:hypothetical protein